MTTKLLLIFVKSKLTPMELIICVLKIFYVFSGYADRLHYGYLTLQCQTKGSMGERSKPALC